MKVLTFFLSIILFSSIVSALGVTGNTLTAVDYYEQGKEYSLSYKFNTLAQIQDYQIRTRSVSGHDITPYIQPSDTLFEQVPPGSAVPFSVSLNFYDESIPPGRHEAHVLVSETQAAGGTIGAKAEVGIRFIIISLFPSEYLIWSLSATNANSGEEVQLKASVRNWGEPDVNGAYVEYKIYDNRDNLVGEVRSQNFFIESKQTEEVITPFDSSNLGVGDYKIIGKLYYSDEVEEKQGSFRLGQKEVKINDITRSFVPNAINKVQVNVESGWNENLEEVRGNVVIIDGREEVADFRLLPAPLEAWRYSSLIGYFDSEGLDLGEYTARVSINYDGESTTKDFDVMIEDGSQTTTLTQVPGSLEFLNFQTIIIILLVAILAFNVYYITRKK
jgi:hypothetical protein